MGDLKQLRSKIDDVDDQILHLLLERVKICEAIGSAKKENALPVRDAEREAQVYRRIRERAAVLGLDSIEIEAVYREIVNMCSSVQK